MVAAAVRAAVETWAKADVRRRSAVAMSVAAGWDAGGAGRGLGTVRSTQMGLPRAMGGPDPAVEGGDAWTGAPVGGGRR